MNKKRGFKTPVFYWVHGFVCTLAQGGSESGWDGLGLCLERCGLSHCVLEPLPVFV